MFQGKKIILCVHEYADFASIIKDGLEKLGLTVIQLDTKQQKFQYKNFNQRLTNFLRKTFLCDKTYKEKLKKQAVEQRLLDEIQQYDAIDYSLLIRADILPKSVLTLIRKKCTMMTGYQWDGLNRFPSIYEYIPLFDRFFVFDPKDLTTPNTLPTTNFYFNHATPFSTEVYRRATFIGSYFKSRDKTLLEIHNTLQKLGVSTDISIYTESEDEIKKVKKLGFQHNNHVLSYEDNLKKMISSEILIDVHINEHEGLSFRIFESIGYDKKIITTNSSVKKYDFYNEQNIFVWDNNNTDKLEQFLNGAYEPVSAKLKEKYSFNNWICYVLDQHNYEAIDLTPIAPTCLN